MKIQPKQFVKRFHEIDPGKLISVSRDGGPPILGFTVAPIYGNSARDLILLPSLGVDQSEMYAVVDGIYFENGPAVVYDDPIFEIDP